MKRHVLNVLLVIVMGAMVVGACAPKATPTTEAVTIPDEIVVGIVEPLTGGYAVFGTNAQFAAELAAKHINDAGGIKSMGGKKIKVIVQDTGDSVDSAKLAMESIIDKYHPVAIIGSYISRWTISLSEITDREKIIYVTDGVVPDVTKQGRQYIFRPSATVNEYGKMAYRFVMETAKANNVEVKTIAVLNEDSLFGRMSTLAISGAALADKIKIVATIEYAYDLTDATPIIQQLKAANPDVIFQTPYYNDGILFAKGYKEMGYYPKFIAASGGSGFVDPQSIEAEGDAAEGLAMAFCYSPDKQTAQNQKFVTDFVAAKGYEPTEAAGGGYMDMMTLYEALELSGKLYPDNPLKPENLRDAFLKLDLTSGPAADVIPSGKIKFSATGDNTGADAAILQVQNGKAVTVFPPEIAIAKPVFPNPYYKP